MARPKIGDALKARNDDTSKSKAKTKASEKAPTQAQPTRQASREGKVNISAYFPPEVKSSLRLVQAKRGCNITEILGEALNLLFAKYGVPETAPAEKR